MILADGEVCHGSFFLPDFAITFQGTPEGQPEVMDGDDESRILRGNDVGSTTIRNLTFTDGNSEGTGGRS